MSYKSWLVKDRPPQDFSETKGRYSHISSMYITLLETSVCGVCVPVCAPRVCLGMCTFVYACVSICVIGGRDRILRLLAKKELNLVRHCTKHMTQFFPI